MRRNDVASTSFRRRVPTRFLINQCQKITFLILKYDIIENSRIELRGIVLPVQVGGLLGGGAKSMLAPPPQIIVGAWPPRPPPPPPPPPPPLTPMILSFFSTSRNPRLYRIIGKFPPVEGVHWRKKYTVPKSEILPVCPLPCLR